MEVGYRKKQTERSHSRLLFDRSFNQLDTVGRALAAAELGGLGVGLVALAVFETGDALHRLIEDAPEGFEPNALGGLGATLARLSRCFGLLFCGLLGLFLSPGLFGCLALA